MPSERYRQALIDIHDNILLAQSFVEDLDQATFVADDKTVYAVIRALEIISEASRKLPEEVRLRHQHLPWRQMAGAGNVYRHDYQNVMADFIWVTLQKSLPELLVVVRFELER
jgi:uncharacterized protein with HEPN domain